MCMTAGLALAALPELAAAAARALMPPRAARRAGQALASGLLLTTTALSLSRIAALRLHYGAPMRVYSALSRVSITARCERQRTIHCGAISKLASCTGRQTSKQQLAVHRQVESVERLVHVCVGGEWHRFPSSFFLPSPAYRLAFVQSNFGGLLPTDFDASKVRSAQRCARLMPATTRLHDIDCSLTHRDRAAPQQHLPI